MTGRTRRIDAGGVTLCVESTGGGEPVVMLHGFTGDAASMLPAARGLGGRFEVHRVELVGHGRSDSPDDVACYTMPRCVSQLRAVFDALGVESAHVYGYSMGGRTALSLAAAHPERVRSLVLVGATAGLASQGECDARVAADEALARRILDDGLEAFVDHWMALPIFASQVRLGPQALAAARSQRLAGSAVGLAHSLRGMGTGAMPPLFDALGRLAMPVLLVVGAEDAKFAAIARSLEGALPAARTLVVPEAGHAAHLERPAYVSSRVAEFLAGVDLEASKARSNARCK